MAKIFNGMIPFASAIQPTGAQPLDDRVVVATMSDLTDATTFGDAKYNGMLVAVVETQQVYMLVDDVNSTNSDSWVQVGTDFSGDISDLSDRVDDIETDVENLTAKLNVSNVSGLGVDDNNALSVKLVADSDNFINGLVATENGLAAATYQLKQRVTGVDDAYAAQYDFTTFTPNGSVVTTINIPKDQVLKSAEILSVTEENLPYTGAKVGDKYIKFEFQNNTTPQYLAVQDLVDVYTADEVYINMSETNVITLDIAAVTNRVSQDLNIANLSSTVSDHTAILNGTNNDGLVANVAKNTEDIDDVAKALDNATKGINAQISTINDNITGLVGFQTILKSEGVVNCVDNTASYGIKLTSEEVGDNGAVVAKINVDIDTLASAVIEAADIPAPIAENISVASAGSYQNSDTKTWNVQAVIEDLDGRITSAVSGGLTKVNGGTGISVTEVSGNAQTISVKTSELVVSGSALTVTDNKIDICWSEL